MTMADGANLSNIKSLCKTYTNLSQTDVKILEQFAQTLPLIGEAQGCDVFIDCPTMDSNNAIVVAEYRPKNSLYQNSVVGMLAHRANEPAAIRTLETGIPSRGLQGLTQESIDIVQNVSAIRNEESRVIGVLIIEQSEFTPFQRHHTEDGIDLTMKYFATNQANLKITSYVNDAIIYFNFEAISVYSNPRAQMLYENFGYRDNITGLPFQNLVLGNVKFSQIIEERSINIEEFVIGDYVLKIKYQLIEEGETTLGVVMLITDITDVRNKENELILKSVVIKEINHRVKNNLQTIASLLRLQSRRVQDQETKKIFVENINRVMSIALTHEILAQNGVDEISIKEVFESLVQQLVQSSAPIDKKIDIKIVGDDIELSSDKATTVSIVLNELVQNCFEHAFVGRNTGEIIIKIERNQTMVTVSTLDNGVGLDNLVPNKKSLGLQIVKSMIKDKLSGSFEMASDANGTKATFTFAFIR